MTVVCPPSYRENATNTLNITFMFSSNNWTSIIDKIFTYFIINIIFFERIFYFSIARFVDFQYLCQQKWVILHIYLDCEGTKIGVLPVSILVVLNIIVFQH